MQCAFELLRIENNRPVVPGEDDGFLFELQRALLLALQESDILTQAQCSLAQQRLYARYGREE